MFHESVGGQNLALTFCASVFPYRFLNRHLSANRFKITFVSKTPFSCVYNLFFLGHMECPE